MDAMREWVAEHFIHLQVFLGIALVFFWLRSKFREDSESRFRVREADRDLKWERGEKARKSGEQVLKKAPLQLGGISIDKAPHEILGVPALASESEIQKAYRELMKRYHPDKIGPPGTREWQDAQAIAEAINQARTAMLERLSRR